MIESPLPEVQTLTQIEDVTLYHIVYPFPFKQTFPEHQDQLEGHFNWTAKWQKCVLFYNFKLLDLLICSNSPLFGG